MIFLPKHPPMNQFLSVLFSFFSLIVLCQSPKKLNAQLREEFVLQHQNYDSVYWAYKQVQVQYAEQTKYLRDLYDQNRTWKNRFDRKKGETKRVYGDLKILKQETTFTPLLDSLEKLKAVYKITTHGAVFRDLENQYNRKQRSWDLEDGVHYQIKDQNVWIKGINQQIWEATGWLMRDQQDMHRLMDSIPLIQQELEDMLRLNRQRFQFAQEAFEKVDAHLRQLRIEFNEKGPESFPLEYSQVFQSVSESIPVNEIVEMPRNIYADEKAVIHEIVDENPEYPGGYNALKKFIAENMVFPKAAIERGIEGKCYVQFTISEIGVPSNFVVKRGVPDCPECDAEAIRVLKLMPNWIPGKQNGKPVKSLYNLPVKFYVSE
jgi:hypothetical protein